MNTPDHSLTPFSIAFSWEGKLQFLQVIPYRLNYANVYRVMKGQECYATFIREADTLHVPAQYQQASSIPKSLHNAIGEELMRMLSKQMGTNETSGIRFDTLEYERIYENISVDEL